MIEAEKRFLCRKSHTTILKCLKQLVKSCKHFFLASKLIRLSPNVHIEWIVRNSKKEKKNRRGKIVTRRIFYLVISWGQICNNSLFSINFSEGKYCLSTNKFHACKPLLFNYFLVVLLITSCISPTCTRYVMVISLIVVNTQDSEKEFILWPAQLRI